jgi:hypothetical protein
MEQSTEAELLLLLAQFVPASVRRPCLGTVRPAGTACGHCHGHNRLPSVAGAVVQQVLVIHGSSYLSKAVQKKKDTTRTTTTTEINDDEKNQPLRYACCARLLLLILDTSLGLFLGQMIHYDIAVLVGVGREAAGSLREHNADAAIFFPISLQRSTKLPPTPCSHHTNGLEGATRKWHCKRWPFTKHSPSSSSFSLFSSSSSLLLAAGRRKKGLGFTDSRTTTRKSGIPIRNFALRARSCFFIGWFSFPLLMLRQTMDMMAQDTNNKTIDQCPFGVVFYFPPPAVHAYHQMGQAGKKCPWRAITGSNQWRHNARTNTGHHHWGQIG